MGNRTGENFGREFDPNFDTETETWDGKMETPSELGPDFEFASGTDIEEAIAALMGGKISSKAIQVVKEKGNLSGERQKPNWNGEKKEQEQGPPQEPVNRAEKKPSALAAKTGAERQGALVLVEQGYMESQRRRGVDTQEPRGRCWWAGGPQPRGQGPLWPRL